MILLGDAAEILKDFNDNCIDLTVTSPPYDKIRSFGGYSDFNLVGLVEQLYRVTKDGGIVVWIVGDTTIDQSESGTSFKQVLYFKEIGFKIHDTMIYHKANGFSKTPFLKYNQCFEYMFVLSKGIPKTFNCMRDIPCKYAGRLKPIGRKRNEEGERVTYKAYYTSEYRRRDNIWSYTVGRNQSAKDDIAFEHGAIFPEQLAQDHIKSWSNEGDLILDPFAGSGTTLKAAHQLNRKWIGIEINPDYVQLAKKRLTPYIQQQRLEQFLI